MSNRDSDGGLIDYPAPPESLVDSVEISEREIGEEIWRWHWEAFGEITIAQVYDCPIRPPAGYWQDTAERLLFESGGAKHVYIFVAGLAQYYNEQLYERVKARLTAAAVGRMGERPDREED